MSDYQDLRDKLTKTSILLVDADSGDVRLIGRAKMAERIMGAIDSSDVAVMMDLSRGLVNFARLAGDEDRDFTIADIEKITGLPYATIDSWIAKQIIAPSVCEGSSNGGRGSARLFSWRDGFVCGVMASLRRQGVGLPLLRRVSTLLAASHAPAIVQEAIA
jgi:hypothetical protein